jgi:hypothetical protein
MPDLLVRDIDPEVYEKMKKAAESQGKSLAQTAREVLAEKFTPSREEIWAQIDAFRESVGPVSGDSVEAIRKAREWPRS